ncbi:pentatricopeptide repeat-containing protein At2g29760, chloroplastic-like [Primulina huaijiensis]|uniref:pentatricopeptide repeat-containing protein At2g29760, chloroplastic-like n=1 Tax=Primulina huaijiensis TaxID=1492673 RepID=UPI003CC75B45
MLKFHKRLTVVSRHNLHPPPFLYTTATSYAPSSSSHHLLHSVVEKCSSMSQLKAIHGQIILRGLTHEIITLSKLISFCAVDPFGDLQYAHYLFGKIPQRNRYMYNILIRASLNDQQSEKALSLYGQMVNSGIFPNEFTFPFILKACAVQKAYLEGVLVHALALKLGFSEAYVFVQNGLINLYVCCGKIECARKVFDGIEFRNLVSWNSVIGGYAKMGSWNEAFCLFHEMRDAGFEPNGHTLVSFLSLCSRIYDVNLGRFVHWYIEINRVDIDVYVQNALLDMYAKCGQLLKAGAVFTRMVDKNVVSWTSMVSAYAKHGFVELAENVFDQMPLKNVVSWNSMISCYLQNGQCKKSLELFCQMCNTGVLPDETTIVSVLSACGQLGDLVTGKKLHAYCHDNEVKSTVTLCNSLVDMYAKCGSTELAFDVFLNMPEKNIVSWNIMISSLALHGFGYKAIKLFQEMETSGIQPDAITFTGLLSACCHCGLIDIGRYFFNKMSHVYRIHHDIEHYACMIDILGRGGCLEEALSLVGKMEIRPDIVIWGALLGACRIHKNVLFAKLVLKQILELEPYTGGLYVLMSNIFCEARQWDDTKKMWKLMKDYGVQKHEAVSSIEISGRISEFMVDGKKHEASDLVYNALNQLMDHLKSKHYEFNVALFAHYC